MLLKNNSKKYFFPCVGATSYNLNTVAGVINVLEAVTPFIFIAFLGAAIFYSVRAIKIKNSKKIISPDEITKEQNKVLKKAIIYSVLYYIGAILAAILYLFSASIGIPCAIIPKGVSF